MAWYFNDHFPWLGMAICAPIIGLWYWCTDQYIVQRALAAPNETEARRGSIFAAFLKLFPAVPVHHPGPDLLRAREERPECGAGRRVVRTACRSECVAGRLPLMVQHLLPSGLRGIVVAGLLSALMGSLAGVFNACSTLFTVDIYEKWSPAPRSRKSFAWVARPPSSWCSFAMAWIPVIKGAHGLYNYLQSVQGYLAPPIFVVLLRRLQQAAQRQGLASGRWWWASSWASSG
jgi:SSS family solute:Na+ symporter